ncbi:MAG: Mu transposase C-terminal domain-containing protein [Bacteroidota bacterium]|jgi:transposase InsO family protein
MNEELQIPIVPSNKITPEIIARVNTFMRFVIVKEGIGDARKQLSAATELTEPTIHWYCIRLRQMFHLAPRSPLASIAAHPQLRQALEVLFTRKQRSDKASLRSGGNIVVLWGDDLKQVSLEQYVISQYGHKGQSSLNVYNALCNESAIGKVFCLTENGMIKCTHEELPSLSTIVRFLRVRRDDALNPDAEEARAIQRSRMSQKQFDAVNFFVRQNPNEFRVRGYLEIDDTETDVQILRTNGQSDRFWCTHVVDFHSSLGCSYYLSYMPNAETASLALRNAFLGNQIKIATPGTDKDGNPVINYVSLPNAMDLPDHIMLDWGKTFHNKQLSRVMGDIEATDSRKTAFNRFCEIHRSTPYHPQSKPHVERSFGVLNQFWKLLPGYTGSNYSGKPESLKEEIKQGVLLAEGDFIRLFELAWNVYNNKPMRRLNGLSRVQYYLARNQHPKQMSERVLDFLLMKNDKHPQVRQGHFTLNTIDYFSPDLARPRYEKQRCDVFYDPQNAGFVHVYFQGIYAATAVNSDLIGQTQREAIEIIKQRGREESILQKKVNEIRMGGSHLQAKANAFMGMIQNVSLLPMEQINRNSTPITILTNIEQQASEVAGAQQEAERMAEMEKKSRSNKKVKLDLTLIQSRIA